jgi:hypothetical protein
VAPLIKKKCFLQKTFSKLFFFPAQGVKNGTSTLPWQKAVENTEYDIWKKRNLLAKSTFCQLLASSSGTALVEGSLTKFFEKIREMVSTGQTLACDRFN